VPFLFFFTYSQKIVAASTDHLKAITLFGKEKYVGIEVRGAPKFIENSFTKSETSLI
jgi:hypothetical protein